jgi:hypothetical protein
MNNKVLWGVGLGLVGFGLWSYFGKSAKTEEKKLGPDTSLKFPDAIPNPWKGTGAPCESAFDKLPKSNARDWQGTKELYDFVLSNRASGEQNDPQVLRLIGVALSPKGVTEMKGCP